jgi:hypothetical protein
MLNRDQGLVAESWVLAGRWWYAVGRPLVPRPKECSHDVGVRCRIVQLLPTTALGSVYRSRDGGRADGRKRGDDVLRARQEIDPDVVRQHEVAFAVDRCVCERGRSTSAPILD